MPRPLFARLLAALLLVATAWITLASASPATAAGSNESAATVGPIGDHAVRTPAANPRTLVVIEDEKIKQTHSTFFAQLTARGHQLHFSMAGEEPSLRLQKFGSANYDNVILMAPGSEELGEGLTVEALQTFLDSGRSIFVAANEHVSETMREILSELAGIDVDEVGTTLQDRKSSSVLKDLVAADVNPKAKRIAGTSSPVLFRGIGHIAQENEYLSSVLVGSKSTVAFTAKQSSSDEPASSGADIYLVSALQTAGNARLIFSGSLDLFSNELLESSPSNHNAEFARAVSMWCFQERGLLRARDLTHYKLGAEHDVSPSSYRVSDRIAFSIVIEEYDGVSDAWRPFVADDVQLELTMLDPYLRVNLETSPSRPGVFTTQFQVPDVYGVYKFVIAYHRIGYANLEVSHKVSVHPFRHDEYERFIPVAYPYYTAAFSIMAAFFLFGIVFLYHKE